VVEEKPANRFAEMVRLNRLIRSFDIAIDLLVVSDEKFQYRRDTPGNVYYEAATGGRSSMKRREQVHQEARRYNMQERAPGAFRTFRWIVADPELLGGKLAIRGTRFSVSFILACLAEGMSIEEIGRLTAGFPMRRSRK